MCGRYRLLYAELARWARRADNPGLPSISSSLTDVVVAMLTTSVSASTSAALAAHN
jgi:hypothetical protein